MEVPIGPSKKVTHACPICGRVFTYYRSWPRKYCSRKCSGKATVTNTGRPTGTRHDAICEVCGVTFETVPSQPGRFCTQRCFGLALQTQYREHGHPRKGIRTGKPAHNALPTVTKPCEICGTMIEGSPKHMERRRFCSKACLGTWQSANQCGENSPTWRGGHLPYYGPSWRPAMRATRRRDRVCQRCGKTATANGASLDVHHQTSFRSYGVERHAEANRLENLTALCHQCHLEVEWATNRRQP